MNSGEFFSYARDKENRIVHIDDAVKGTEYFCIECGSIMVPCQGKKNRWHYRHERNIDNCCYETYLHKLAKRIIRECINHSEDFCIAYSPTENCDVPASECPIKKSPHCSWKGWIKSVDLKSNYDVCEEEVRVGNLKPDLLLRNSKVDGVPPIFIEICVKHKCSEEKLSSGNCIIEIEIEKEEDIEFIVEKGFIREPSDRFDDDYNNRFKDRIRFYNFPEEDVCPREDKQVSVYIFTLDKWKRSRETALCRATGICGSNDGRIQIVSSQEIYDDLARRIIIEHTSSYKKCIACRYFVFNSVPNGDNRCTKRSVYRCRWSDMACSSFEARRLLHEMNLSQVRYTVYGG